MLSIHLFDMTVCTASYRLLLDHRRHAEYARPNELELVLSAVQAMAQPNAPDDVAVLLSREVSFQEPAGI